MQTDSNINRDISVAIEALKAQLGTDKNARINDDCISRQAAIDAFDGVKVDEENCTEYDIGYNDGIDFAISKLSVLPPAQPEPCEDAVSREEVLNCLEWQYPDKTPRTKIMGLPPVTPKQRTGKWIKADVCGDITSWECSCCHNWTGLPKRWDVNKKLWFCPKCGMKMEGEHNG